MKRPRLLPYLLVAPTLIFVTVFTLLPLAEVLVGSLFKQRLNIPRFQNPVFVGWGNFADLFGDPEFLQVLLNTALYVVASVPAALAAALVLAFLADRKLPGITALRLALFHPAVLPMVSAATVWLFLFTPDYGLWNQALHALGYAGPQNWTGNPALALGSLAVVAFWKSAGFFMLFFLAGLQNLDRSVLEAARLDGAQGWRLVGGVILPLLRRQTVFVSSIAFIGAFQTVDHVFVLTQGGPSGTSDLMLYDLWQRRFERLDVGQGDAVTVLLVAVLLVFTMGNFLWGERRER
jgi:sn-glycerol 3-phosphate transport system permease protein